MVIIKYCTITKQNIFYIIVNVAKLQVCTLCTVCRNAGEKDKKYVESSSVFYQCSRIQWIYTLYTYIISCVNLKYAIIMHYMRDRLSLWYAVHFVIENLRKIKIQFENTLSQGPKWARIMTENGGGQALWNTPIINGVN